MNLGVHRRKFVALAGVGLVAAVICPFTGPDEYNYDNRPNDSGEIENKKDLHSPREFTIDDPSVGTDYMLHDGDSVKINNFGKYLSFYQSNRSSDRFVIAGNMRKPRPGIVSNLVNYVAGGKKRYIADPYSKSFTGIRKIKITGSEQQQILQMKYLPPGMEYVEVDLKGAGKDQVALDLGKVNANYIVIKTGTGGADVFLYNRPKLKSRVTIDALGDTRVLESNKSPEVFASEFDSESQRLIAKQLSREQIEDGASGEVVFNQWEGLPYKMVEKGSKYTLAP